MTKKEKKKVRQTGLFLFVLYLLGISYFLFFSEQFGRTNHNQDYRYNLVLFQEIKRYLSYFDKMSFGLFILNIFGNIFAFTPFGFCLPLIKPRFDHFFRILLSSMLFSLTIETIQLVFKVGSFDVDDILLNTFGAVLGFFCFRIMLWIHKKLDAQKKNKNCKGE